MILLDGLVGQMSTFDGIVEGKFCPESAVQKHRVQRARLMVVEFPFIQSKSSRADADADADAEQSRD